jgi:hypothetical protein
MSNGDTDRQDGGMLVRIIVMLLSLAALADRAATYPAPVRCVVLWLLRRAEIVTRLFVIGLAADCGFRANVAAPVLSRGRDGPADAAALADAFAILAEVLNELLPYVDAMPEFAAQAACRLSRRLASAVTQALTPRAVSAVPFPDTS